MIQKQMQLVKNLQQRSLHEVIEDILPLVLNTKRPLSDIWLLSYKQNNFGCFWEKLKLPVNCPNADRLERRMLLPKVNMTHFNISNS